MNAAIKVSQRADLIERLRYLADDDHRFAEIMTEAADFIEQSISVGEAVLNGAVMPKRIWLMDLGSGDVTWCDSPNPDGEQVDSVEYVLAPASPPDPAPEGEGLLDRFLTQPEATQVMCDAATKAVGHEGPWRVIWSAMYEVFARHRLSTPPQDRVTGALDDLQQAEAEYRLMHDRHGDGSQAAGRAWDLMRRAGGKARAVLASLNKEGDHG